MERIIDKLQQLDDGSINAWDNWSIEEQKKLLEIYFIISKKENQIFTMIYNHHGCDSFEDIFRDYDENYLAIKAQGVEVAINETIRKMNEQEED